MIETDTELLYKLKVMGFLGKRINYLVMLCIFFFGQVYQGRAIGEQQLTVSIPTKGNSWLINDILETSSVITSKGIENWSDPKHIIRTFFYVERPGKLFLGIKANVRSGTSLVQVSFGADSKKINLSNTDQEDIYIGEFAVNTIGYYFVDIQGLQKDANVFAEVNAVLLGYEGTGDFAKYVKDDFYFGRRGPSTHLIFDNPEGVDEVEWFYNEIEISEGNDVIGSYYMAAGCKEGYFGIQVNSPTERRILFSIWSPFQTDNPKAIPEDQKITLLKKGDKVNTGEFGNEGSGGQSYKVYDWKTNTRYGFLLGAKPTGNNTTIYSAYFYNPEMEEWDLIARFERPKTNTYLKGLYSFLENFVPNTGAIERRGDYFNQWVKDADGKWHEITEARFSADATARKDARLDYSGGTNGQGFYLKNCGFTNDKIEIGTHLLREKSNAPPSIDFSALDN